VTSEPDWNALPRDPLGAAHPAETPLVFDPSAGRGSMPVEAFSQWS